MRANFDQSEAAIYFNSLIVKNPTSGREKNMDIVASGMFSTYDVNKT